MKMWKRIVVVAGISAVTITGLSGPVSAQSQQQNHGRGRARGHGQGQDGQQDGRGRLSQVQQQERIRQQERRTLQFRQQMDQQQRLSRQRTVELQRDNRRAQLAYQQQYVQRLRDQQWNKRTQNRYNYDNDPFFYTPSSYRYTRGGRTYDTNQYGVDLLRQAVSYGYEEGVRAGQADRQDRSASKYQDSFAYQDASYGYSGFYVERDDYNFYFREGFSRGYEDGYGKHQRFGSVSSAGKSAILGTVLTGILPFAAIR